MVSSLCVGTLPFMCGRAGVLRPAGSFLSTALVVEILAWADLPDLLLEVTCSFEINTFVD